MLMLIEGWRFGAQPPSPTCLPLTSFTMPCWEGRMLYVSITPCPCEDDDEMRRGICQSSYCTQPCLGLGVEVGTMRDGSDLCSCKLNLLLPYLFLDWNLLSLLYPHTHTHACMHAPYICLGAKIHCNFFFIIIPNPSFLQLQQHSGDPESVYIIVH